MLRFLKVQFQAITDDFNNSIKGAQREAKEFDKTIRPTKQLLADVGTAATAAGLAIVGSMTAMAKATADYGDALAEQSEKTGVAVGELAKLKYAAEQNDATFEDLAAGMRILARNANEAADGSKAQAKSFAAIGVAATDSSGKIRPLNDVLLDVSDRFKLMKDGPEKAAIAMELFGRSGTNLIPILNLGREGIKAAGDELERFGGVIDADAARAGDEFNKVLGQMKTAVMGLSLTIGTAILPSLKGLAESARDSIVAFKDFAKEHQTLTKAIYGTGAALIGAGGLALGLSSVLGLVGKLSVAVKGLAAVVSPLALGIAGAAAAVIYFRNELLMLGRAVAGELSKALEGILGNAARVAELLGRDGLATSLRETSFSIGQFSRDMEAANAAAYAQSMIVPAVTQATKAAAKSSDDYSVSLKRSNAEAAAMTEKLAEMRAELAKDQLAFERAASLDLWKSQQDQLEEYMVGLRRAAAAVLAMVQAQQALRESLADSIIDLNKRVQEELDAQTRRTNKETIDGILKVSEERKRAMEKEKESLRRATEDIKRSAGAVFDAMFIKGESVFKSLQNALKGGALSLGRSIFEDITAALLGPVKKAFDDFIGGILGGVTKKLGDVFGGLLGTGASDWQGPLQSAIGGGASAAGSVGGAAGSVGGAASSGLTRALIGGAGVAVGIGQIFQQKRLEGTMNAVEFNTRATRIHSEVMINELLHPIKNYTQFTAEQQGEHTNQLDAIFKAIVGTTGGGSNNIYQTGRVFAGQQTAATTPPVVNISSPFAPVITLPPATDRDAIMSTMLDALDINYRGYLQELVQVIRGAAPGVVSGVA